MMKTECTEKLIEFQGAGRRRVEARFDAGCVSSDGGLLLLREVVERSGLLEAFAASKITATRAASSIRCYS